MLQKYVKKADVKNCLVLKYPPYFYSVNTYKDKLLQTKMYQHFNNELIYVWVFA